MMVNVSYRRDLWIRVLVSLVLSLFFLFLGSDSITDIVWGEYFLADLSASFLLVFIITSWISLLSGYFDRHYAWNTHTAARIVYQLIAGILIPAAFVLGYMYLYLIVVLGFRREEVPFFHTEFPISVLFIIFWNLLYAGYYFYRESRHSYRQLESLKQQLFTFQHVQTGINMVPESQQHNKETGLDDDDEPGLTSPGPSIRILVAVSGNKNIPIPVETIAYIHKKGTYTTLTTFQSETYLLNHPLDELIKLLDPALFFRANRQFIINLKACHYFTNEENGKLAIHLLPAYEEEVTISQKRSSAFKEWLNR
jgi:hypothetical protein